jgi:hypothetical protein
MLKRFLFIVILSFMLIPVFAQTGIGTTTPHASAKLEVASSTQGFLPPRIALTATNSASPISSPANGLMVFNTASAGASPFNVVPGYYYWDVIGQQWVSLSTTVGNVQNQAIFRSSSNTSAGQAITSWNSRFNNIASGDLTVNSSTTFTLSNGLYKIEWALPYQSSNTYNTMQLQELSSGNWGPFRGDGGYANLSNGGNTDWGGGTFAADILDCSSGSKTIRIINNDGATRTLFYGVNLIITKLNPSITTSTTADNLGDHTATKNILLNGNYLSNDGGNEGIRVDNSGNVGIGTATPTSRLNIAGGGVKLATGFGNSTNRPSLNTSTIGNYEIRGVGSITGTAQNDSADDGFLRLSAGGGTSVSSQSSIDISGFSTVSDMSNNIVMRTGGAERLRIDNSGNVNMTGKLNIGDPTGNVSTKLVGRVTTGNFLTFDNLRFSVTNSGGLILATTSGSVNFYVEGRFNNGGGYILGARTAGTVNYTTTPSTSLFGWGFGSAGDTIIYHFTDPDNSRMYRVTLIIMPSYINNFIAIERIL